MRKKNSQPERYIKAPKKVKTPCRSNKRQEPKTRMEENEDTPTMAYQMPVVVTMLHYKIVETKKIPCHMVSRAKFTTQSQKLEGGSPLLLKGSF